MNKQQISCYLRLAICILALLCCQQITASQNTVSRFSDSKAPLKIDEVPKRVKPLIEWGDTFLGRGDIKTGSELPTGAIIQPSLMVFGNFRTALQAFDDGDDTFSEWSNRLDIFANLQLTATERLLIGFRPLDQNGRFTGYNFEPNSRDGFRNHINGNIETLFFEGDIGEIFPNWDREDFKRHDIGFSIGRQPIFFQDGILINDTMDALTITKNSIIPKFGSNIRASLVAAVDDIHRNDNIEMSRAKLLGIFTRSDLPQSTIDADLIWVYDDGGSTDSLNWGLSAISRFGHLNTTFRILGSYALEQTSAQAGNGQLFFTELSTTPAYSHDLIYADGFVAVDRFTSAARGPATGGPLGRVGLLFAAVGLGRYGSPIANDADNAAGAAIGYQKFFAENRRQLIVELGGRAATRSNNSDDTLALGVRLQQAYMQHLVLVFDAFGRWQQHQDDSFGVRTELVVKF